MFSTKRICQTVDIINHWNWIVIRFTETSRSFIFLDTHPLKSAWWYMACDVIVASPHCLFAKPESKQKQIQLTLSNSNLSIIRIQSLRNSYNLLTNTYNTLPTDWSNLCKIRTKLNSNQIKDGSLVLKNE